MVAIILAGFPGGTPGVPGARLKPRRSLASGMPGSVALTCARSAGLMVAIRSLHRPWASHWFFATKLPTVDCTPCVRQGVQSSSFGLAMCKVSNSPYHSNSGKRLDRDDRQYPIADRADPHPDPAISREERVEASHEPVPLTTARAARTTASVVISNFL